jgi:phosphocarrier protein HPr
MDFKLPFTSGNKTIQRDFTIKNKFGIHARPAALFVKTVSRFTSDITVSKDGHSVPGKSIMGLLTIEGYQNSVIRVTANGPDAEAAIAAVASLIDNKFNED